MWTAREPKLTRSGDWSLPKVVLCGGDHRFHRASAAALAISRRRASCDAERSVDGFDGPVDSRSKRGNRRGNHGWLAASPAQLNLGNMYDTGRGVPQDYAEALRWYRLAAE